MSQRVRLLVSGAITVVLLSMVAAEPTALGATVTGKPGRGLWPGVWTDRWIPGQDLHGLVVTPDGSLVVVTGTSSSPDYATIAYDAATGARRWTARYDGPGHSYEASRGLVVAPDSSMVVVTGFSLGVDSGDDYATVAYATSTGAELWVSRYDGPTSSIDNAEALAISPDGSTVVVTGGSLTHGNYHYITIAYDAKTGAELWTSRHADIDGAFAWDVAVTPDSSTAIVTGGSGGAGTGSDFGTIAYDLRTGNELWFSRYNQLGSSFESYPALAVSPDGSTVAVLGQSARGVWSDIAAVAYDAATGAQRWAAIYDGPGSKNDTVGDVTFSNDNSLIVATGSTFVANDQMLTIAFDATTGAQRWVSIYQPPAPGGSQGNALASSPDGQTVTVTGFGFGVGTSGDFTTVVYDMSTGSQLSVARAGRQDYDSAQAIAVSPDGSTTFVAGDIGPDYWTIAYSS